MSLNYAQQWEKELLAILVQNSLISPFITTNVKWLDAKTFHFTQMSVSGFKSHNRDGGWNKGKYTQTDVPYTVTHDRDVEFFVDSADVDETNETASIKNISETFELTQVTPESHALFFSKCATLAKSLEGYNTETALADFTEANVFTKLKKMLGAGKLRRYKAQGALIAYVRSEIMDMLELSKELQKKIEMTQIAEGGVSLETRVTYIDGVPIMEVIDDECFYDEFKWDPVNDSDPFDGGFEPAEGAKAINVLIASPLTTKYVPKVNSIYYFKPGQHTQGDGYLYQNRELSDVFTFPNGKDGKIDSLFVDVQP